MKKSEELTIKNQHNVLTSILLHLIPGIIILGGIFLFYQPLFCNLLGFDTRFGPLLGWLMSLTFCLIPVLLGILLFVGKKQNKSLTFTGVIGNTEKSPTKEYFLYIPLYFVFAFLLMFLVAPSVNEFFVAKLFWWYPQEYNFQALMQDPVSMKR